MVSKKEVRTGRTSMTVVARKKRRYSPRHNWTEEERDFIRVSYRHTVDSRREIAQLLGVSEDAVAGQIERQGVGKRIGRRRWTEEEDEQLGDLIGRCSVTQIAKRMKRSVQSVVIRARRLHYSRRTRDGWFTKREVSEILGVDHKRVQGWIDRGELIARWHSSVEPRQRGGASWHIETSAVRDFIVTHAGELTGRNVELQVIVWLLTGEL